MAELLLELFSEEIPARMQQPAVEQLHRLVTTKLDEADLTYGVVEGFVTPRRLALRVEGLPTEQEERVTERKGPRVGAPEQALEGFLRSTGLTMSDLEQKETAKGSFYFAVVREEGKTTQEILLPVLEGVLQSMRWPKSMRWGNHTIRWVRPLQNICCVFDGQTVPVTFGHLTANNTSQAHRFMGDGKSFEVINFEDYKEKLSKSSVMLGTDERKFIIEKEARRLAETKGLKWKEDRGLLDEVAGLVEQPVVLMGGIDEVFMEVPHEVLVSSMRTHQKYFSLVDDKGLLAPYFIVVSNINTQNNAHILAGNERVLRARLSDAMFFWQQDRARSLESRVVDLKRIVFHAKLGTVADKVKRMTALAKLLSIWIPHANLVSVERAATLCKADLTSGMVGEFAELQGVMGAYYAQHDGEGSEVVSAIFEHYRPQGPDDVCPAGGVSIAVALADKIDSLMGLFLIDEQPTGSKDPYALRRAALGVIRIILENRLRVPIKLLFEKSLNQYPASLCKPVKEVGAKRKMSLLMGVKSHKESDGDGAEHERESAKKKRIRVIDEMLSFFEERLKSWLKRDNVRHDLIAAVFDGGNEDDLYRVVKRVKSLDVFIDSEDGKNLLAAYRRATNIVRIEEKKDQVTYSGKVSKDSLVQDEERALFLALKENTPLVTKALKGGNFEEAMQLLSQLRSPVDVFFEKVTVNCDNADVRVNRLKLLSQIRSFIHEIANFEMIEG